LRKRGITLIELISVVVCMAIIIGASSTSVYTAIVHTSKVKASRAVYDRNALFEASLKTPIYHPTQLTLSRILLVDKTFLKVHPVNRRMKTNSFSLALVHEFHPRFSNRLTTLRPLTAHTDPKAVFPSIR
jgi:Tfp pilus assembly protein PilE